MPLLEAMNYRIPILASDIPAHREASGRAALYCDPNNAADITHKLVLLLKDNNLRASLTKDGTERLSEFSWKSVADAVMDNIRGAVSGKQQG